MSLVPAFGIGVWNAWILIIPVLFVHIVNARVVKRRGAGGQAEKIPVVLFLILHILPVFLPLKLNTAWFYLGLVFYILGITMTCLGIYSFATTPVDKLVTKGVFRYSRNPMYLGVFILSFGISLASGSWVYFLIALIWIVVLHVTAIPIEESECVKKYGTDYTEYMNRTPRWLGIPKTLKSE